VTVFVSSLHEGPQAPGLAEVLSGALGVDEVRRLVIDPWRHGLGAALTQAVPTHRVGSIEVLRSKFKPGRRLRAYYLVHTVGAPVQVAVTWDLEPDGASGEHISVLASPHDPDMPQLARLSDPVHLAEVAGPLTSSAPLLHDAFRIRTLRYRPGQRHVLRATEGTRRGGVIVKTDREGSGEVAVRVAAALRRTLSARSPRVALVEPLGWVPGDRAALWRLAEGLPLSRRLREPGRDSTPHLELVGRTLRLVHDDVSVAESLREVLPLTEPGGEAAATLRAAEHLQTLLPSASHSLHEILRASAAALASLPPEPPTLIHGDLKADNLLAGRQLHILDLDRAALGDPAVDLAKLVADLHWWSPPTTEPSALVAALRRGYGTAADDRWARAGVLVPVFMLRFAARRCPVHEPDWANRVRAQVASAARASLSGPAS
jgi:aminoglycoside phosphotransferase (APT) family kinase protein